LIASYQVADALKILCGHPDLVQPRITTVDLWHGGTRQIPMPASDADCPSCGRRQFDYLEEPPRATARLCGRNAVQVQERFHTLDLAELKSRLERLGEVRASEFALRFFLAPYEMTVFPDGRAIIKGTSDTGLARSLYARYVG
jgi:adenylyltransferase/sulfurtransferase